MRFITREIGRAWLASLTAAAVLTCTPHARAQLPCAYEADIIFGPNCGGELGRARPSNCDD